MSAYFIMSDEKFIEVSPHDFGIEKKDPEELNSALKPEILFHLSDYKRRLYDPNKTTIDMPCAHHLLENYL